MKKVSGFPRQDSSLNPSVNNYRDNEGIFMFLLDILNPPVTCRDYLPAAIVKSAG